jgi:hypothetical protein
MVIMTAASFPYGFALPGAAGGAGKCRVGKVPPREVRLGTHNDDV